jgi:hypothetical protein
MDTTSPDQDHPDRSVDPLPPEASPDDLLAALSAADPSDGPEAADRLADELERRLDAIP